MPPLQFMLAMSDQPQDQNLSTNVPSLTRSIVTGAVGFSLVSLAVFATVAFGERWMYQTLGILGAYLTWTVLFVMLSGAVFGSLVVGRWRLPKFYLLFGLAFFVYAANWMFAYFTLRGTAAGELVGALAGSVLMAVVFAAAFESLRSTVKLSAILFVTNSVGYFLGSTLNNYFRGHSGMLLWGVMYGLFFGAGIGAVLQLAQINRDVQKE